MVAEREDIHWARGVGNGRIDLSLEGRPAPGGEGTFRGRGKGGEGTSDFTQVKYGSRRRRFSRPRSPGTRVSRAPRDLSRFKFGSSLALSARPQSSGLAVFRPLFGQPSRRSGVGLASRS